MTAARTFVALRLLAVVTLVAVAITVTPVIGQPAAQTETNRFLKDAIDMHFHRDPPAPEAKTTQADIAQVRLAKQRGLRGTDRELDIMVKENPARLLDLPVN